MNQHLDPIAFMQYAKDIETLAGKLGITCAMERVGDNEMWICRKDGEIVGTPRFKKTEALKSACDHVIAQIEEEDDDDELDDEE